MTRLVDFRDAISPLSWLIYGTGMVLIWIVVLGPTWTQLLVTLVIDAIFLTPFFAKLVDPKVFLRRHPDAQPFFSGIDHAAVARMTSDERRCLLATLSRFPEVRARHILIFSFVYKLVPGVLLIVFYWDHQCSNWEQFLKMMAILLVYYSYLYGIAYFENHELCSRIIDELHAKHDFSPIFASYRPSGRSSRYLLAEGMALAPVLVFLIVLCGALVAAYRPGARDGMGLEWQIGIVGVSGIALAGRVWLVSRRYLFHGLERIFDRFDGFDPKTDRDMLPVHSLGLLARFEATFNSLAERLKADEQELADLVARQADKLRFESLGEISGLISHDLSQPLNVVLLAAEMLNEDPGKGADPRVRERLAVNARHAADLVESLRAYLKNQDSDSDSSSLVEAHEHVVRLLGFQVDERMAACIQLALPPELSDVRLKMGRSNLIHVLSNLYSNALHDMSQSGVAAPALLVEGEPSTDRARFTVFVEDNGSGLSFEKFEAMTALRVSSAGHMARQGLGLRLIRRLVEQHGGDLQVVPTRHARTGTRLALTLLLEAKQTARGPGAN